MTNDEELNTGLLFPDGHKHWVDPRSLRWTMCGLAIDPDGEWVVSDASFCWRCMQVMMERQEMSILREVLDAATAVVDNEFQSGDVRGRLMNAVEQYWGWANYEGEVK